MTKKRSFELIQLLDFWSAENLFDEAAYRLPNRLQRHR